MKKLERFMIQVESAHPEQSIIIGKTKEEERKIVKGIFHDIHPSDELVLYATMEKNKKYGTHFQATHYIEKKTQNWLMKRLKYEFNLSDETIMEYILYPSKHANMKQYLQEAKTLQMVSKKLKEKGIDEEWIAKIEQKFLWNFKSLLEDVYQLLSFPSIRIDWLEEWITEGIVKGKKETKTYYYAQQLLQDANSQGHFYLPLREVEALLQKKDLSLLDIQNFDVFHKEKGKLYLKEYHEIELSIVENIKQRLQQRVPSIFSEHVVSDWEQGTGFTLATNQKEAVWMALNQLFCVVTGGPGVGKTTVCKCITDVLGSQYTIKMVAPTGRAAKRAQESTGLDTSTIHSLLEYNGIRFQRNKEIPIETDVLVIDESSMIDAPLLFALLQATPIQTMIIFVGDVDQLPSVGPGQILRDLIQSSVIPVTRLTEIFRQAADSPIIQCAYAVNDGNVPDLTTHEFLEYLEHEDECFVLKNVLSVSKKLYQEHSLFDVQVLIPMYDGVVGIDEVNRKLQHHLNPDAPAVKVGEYELRLGDKVIQTKNVKTKKIYNGDVGVITSVSSAKIKVKFQGHDHETSYESHEFWHLQLAYAVTVHRAQGSEYLFVVIPLVESYRHMLQKNLFYTAITRAKKKLWIMYQMEAMKQAVRLESVPVRYTGLAEKLNQDIV